MPRVARSVEECVALLKEAANSDDRDGMARFGINIDAVLGVRMPAVRAIGSSTVKDHDLALGLWDTGYSEARILAALVDKPEWVTRDQCEAWAEDFNSWDVVDQVCGNLFDRLPYADDLVRDWHRREEEFIKRAGIVLIAWMAVHLKKRPDSDFLNYLPILERCADDDRNFVKKAVSWSLRQIGKRSAKLHPEALKLANALAASENKTARWIGNDAAKELSSQKMRDRLGL